MVNEIRGRVWPGRFATFLALLWILFVALGAQAAGWLAPGLGWRPDTLNAPVQTAIVQALLVIVPLGLLARFWRGPRYRAIFGLWFGAGLFALCLAPTRLLASTQGQVIMLLQWLIMAIFFVVVRHMLQGERRRLIDLDALLPALIGSALFAIPWLALGALGSMLDIIISLLAALFFGLTASALIDGVWLRSLTLDRRGAARDLFTGGVVIGVTLLLMGSGLAFNGMQLLLMVALSAWGWFVMGLTSMGQPYGSSRNSLAVALFVALAAAAPLLLIDSDSMLFEALDPGALRAWRAIVPVALLGWVLGVILLFAHDRVMDMRPTRLGLVGVGTCWLLGLLVFAGIGQPGFYGDRLFVVMAEQIDVSAAASIADYDERRKQVYISLVEHAEQEQADLRRLLDRFGVAYRPYYLVNGLEVQGGLLARLWLSTRNDVARVLYNPILRPIDGPPPTNKGVEPAPDGLEWNLTSIGADRVWSDFGVRGQGIVIGQSDSGVDATHPELESSYRGRGDDHDYNWLDPWYDSRAPVDWNGHGTHTLGSVLGAGVGVAPGADWFGCANLARNLGNPARYLDCMQFMLAPHPQAGDPFHDGDPTRSAHVTNNSWGCPGQAEGCDALTMQSAVAAMRAAGIFTVVSAGNDGPGCATVDAPLAIYDEIFSVGAVNVDGDLALFSSAGPVLVDGSRRIKPDILAPGVAVLSAYPGGTYEIASGTSMAGPHVAGVVALIWSANPELIGDIEGTEEILAATTRPFGGDLGGIFSDEELEQMADQVGEESPIMGIFSPAQGAESCHARTALDSIPNNVAGYGIVDAYAAVQLAITRK